MAQTVRGKLGYEIQPDKAAGTLTSPYDKPQLPGADYDEATRLLANLGGDNNPPDGPVRVTRAAGTLTSPYNRPKAKSGSPSPPTPIKTKPVSIETRSIKVIGGPLTKAASNPTKTFAHQNSYLKSLGQNTPSKGNSYRRYDEKK